MRRSTDKLPAAALALSTCKVWEVIRSQRDLNLPAHKVPPPPQPTLITCAAPFPVPLHPLFLVANGA